MYVVVQHSKWLFWSLIGDIHLDIVQIRKWKTPDKADGEGLVRRVLAFDDILKLLEHLMKKRVCIKPAHAAVPKGGARRVEDGGGLTMGGACQHLFLSCMVRESCSTRLLSMRLAILFSLFFVMEEVEAQVQLRKEQGSGSCSSAASSSQFCSTPQLQQQQLSQSFDSLFGADLPGFVTAFENKVWILRSGGNMTKFQGLMPLEKIKPLLADLSHVSRVKGKQTTGYATNKERRKLLPPTADDIKVLKRVRGEDGSWWTGFVPMEKLWLNKENERSQIQRGVDKSGRRGRRRSSSSSSSNTNKEEHGQHQRLDADLIDYLFHRKNFSVLVNRVNHRVGEIELLAKDLASDFESIVDVNMYLTPADSQAFEAHWDYMESVVLQVYGSKVWSLYKGGVPLSRFDQKYKPRDDEDSVPSPSATSSMSLHLTVGIEVPSVCTYTGLLHRLIDTAAVAEWMNDEQEEDAKDGPPPPFVSTRVRKDLLHLTLAVYSSLRTMVNLRRRVPVPSAFNLLSHSLLHPPEKCQDIESEAAQRGQQPEEEENDGGHQHTRKESYDNSQCTWAEEDEPEEEERGGDEGRNDRNAPDLLSASLKVDITGKRQSHLLFKLKAFIESIRKELLQQTVQIQLERRILMLLDGDSEEYPRSFGMPLPRYDAMSQPLERMRKFFHKTSNEKTGYFIDNAKKTFKEFLSSEDVMSNQSLLITAVNWLSTQCMQ
eukprot:jgi/Bigna1/75796/fgenesh1_pg.37_\